MDTLECSDEGVGLRVAPHSNEAEQCVLGCLLIDNLVWGRACDLLNDHDFYRHDHRSIFAAIVSLVSNNKPADVITVFDRLASLGKEEASGGLTYLNALAQCVPSAANMRRYAEIVKRHSTMRQLISAAADASTIAWTSGDPADALDKITSIFGSLQLHQLRKAPRTISAIAVERLDHYTALEEGAVKAGWSTHIPALDFSLNGGVRAGNLYVIAARPSVGKSSFAQQLGQTFAHDGLTTLFCSMEMGESEIADRGVASVGRLSYRALLTGTMGQESWRRAGDALDQLAGLPLYVDDQPALTLRDIRFKAKSVKGLKVLIIDYLQLCMASGAKRDANRNSEIEEISRGLKALAKELGIAVFALSQLNRAVEQRAGKRPTLSDLRDSGAIEQDADVVMLMWSVRQLEGEGRRIVGIGLDKNRHGRVGEFGLDFFGDMQSWAESTADIRTPLRGHRGDL